MSDEIYWRAFEEHEAGKAAPGVPATEFPRAPELALGRRDFLKMVGGAAAMMLAAACKKPLANIFPYQEDPENLVPGKPRFYATGLPLGGGFRGVLVESHEGRPTKIEGNPSHPDSLGAADAAAQAAILELYDPERSQAVMSRGVVSTWEDFLKALAPALAAADASGGEGVRVLTGAPDSPSLEAGLAALMKRFPRARRHAWEPLSRANAAAGARLAFGEDVLTRVDLARAGAIVALDADFLGCGASATRHARAFADGRALTGGRTEMSRLYAVEPCPTVTGAAADHRLPLRAADVAGFARLLARELGVEPGPGALEGAEARRWARAIARDLVTRAGRAVVIAGDAQPPVVHALAHAMNAALGSAAVSYAAPDQPFAAPVDSLKALVADMEAGKVSLLAVLGGNPGHDAPADVPFARALGRVPLRVRLGLHEDETSALCHWHIPEAHPLETWGDGRASDGTVTLIQPLIDPLYGGKSPLELLSALTDKAPRSAHDLVKEHWRGRARTPDFEGWWRKALRDGVVEGTARPVRRPRLRAGLAREASPAPAKGLELVLRPDPHFWDGRSANNAWLQELPRPLTKLTWDNAALMGPETARRLGVESEDAVRLTLDGRSVTAPVLIAAGHAEESVTVHLGWGRRGAGSVAAGRGFDAYPLRAAGALDFAGGLAVEKTGERLRLARVHDHHSVEGRDVVRAAPLDRYRRDPRFAHKDEDWPERDESMYKTPPLDGQVGWGMSIDTSACIGCMACVAACQAENNIPTVGKEEVLRGREMHWIRVDTYFSGAPAAPEAVHAPVPCMHCEDAPCEPVCPVGATVHGDEGLNEQVYNRCIGTRYCSNNCPYKVRRFNFFQYSDDDTETYKLMRNPDVTVRARGVMEKCTYCVQRINAAKIAAEEEGRPVRDGEAVPACAQTCPARAIVFGNVKDPETRVSKLKKEPRRYALLGELGTRPRTTYLAKVRNPNPELA